MPRHDALDSVQTRENSLRQSLRRFIVIVASAFTACSVLTGPDYPSLPPENKSLDPADVRVGYTLYGCGGWWDGHRPPGDRMFADVFFGGEVPPNAIHYDRVRRKGGVVVYEFRVQGYRIWVPIDSIPTLGGTVRSVPDLARYDLDLGVKFSHVFGAADSAAIQALGGRKQYPYDSGNLVSVLLPDASIPALLRSPDVESVFAPSAPGCAF